MPSGPSNHASAIVVPLPSVGLRGCLVWEVAEVQLLVGATDGSRFADLDHVAPLHQHRAIAEALDGVHVVGDEHDRPALALESEELLEALLLEGGIADREHLVDQQDLGFNLDRGGKGQAHEHSRGVVLELEVDELLEFGKRDHGVETAFVPRGG